MAKYSAMIAVISQNSNQGDSTYRIFSVSFNAKTSFINTTIFQHEINRGFNDVNKTLVAYYTVQNNKAQLTSGSRNIRFVNGFPTSIVINNREIEFTFCQQLNDVQSSGILDLKAKLEALCLVDLKPEGFSDSAFQAALNDAIRNGVDKEVLRKTLLDLYNAWNVKIVSPEDNLNEIVVHNDNRPHNSSYLLNTFNEVIALIDGDDEQASETDKLLNSKVPSFGSTDAMSLSVFSSKPPVSIQPVLTSRERRDREYKTYREKASKDPKQRLKVDELPQPAGRGDGLRNSDTIIKFNHHVNPLVVAVGCGKSTKELYLVRMKWEDYQGLYTFLRQPGVLRSTEKTADGRQERVELWQPLPFHAPAPGQPRSSDLLWQDKTQIHVFTPEQLTYFNGAILVMGNNKKYPSSAGLGANSIEDSQLILQPVDGAALAFSVWIDPDAKVSTIEVTNLSLSFLLKAVALVINLPVTLGLGLVIYNLLFPLALDRAEEQYQADYDNPDRRSYNEWAMGDAGKLAFLIGFATLYTVLFLYWVAGNTGEKTGEKIISKLPQLPRRFRSATLTENVCQFLQDEHRDYVARVNNRDPGRVDELHDDNLSHIPQSSTDTENESTEFTGWSLHNTNS